MLRHCRNKTALICSLLFLKQAANVLLIWIPLTLMEYCWPSTGVAVVVFTGHVAFCMCSAKYSMSCLLIHKEFCPILSPTLIVAATKFGTDLNWEAWGKRKLTIQSVTELADMDCTDRASETWQWRESERHRWSLSWNGLFSQMKYQLNSTLHWNWKLERVKPQILSRKSTFV